MAAGALGRLYQDGEIIVQEGDKGDCLFNVCLHLVKEIIWQD